MEKALLKTINKIAEEMMKHPGAGAQRAIAVLSTLSANQAVPWNRLSKFKVNWVSRTKDDALCPEVEMEFHPEDDIVVIAADYQKVLIHEEEDGEVHVVAEPFIDAKETLCGQRLHPISSVHIVNDKIPATCKDCLAKVGV